MEIVLNATPLIYYAKSGFHACLSGLFSRIMTTEEVLDEVLTGDFPEQERIKRMVGKTIFVEKANLDRSFMVPELDLGEASALSLAKERNIPLVSDDKAAIIHGRANGLKVVHSTFPIFLAVARKTITKADALGYVDRMVAEGWFCDVGTYVRIRNGIERI